MILMQKAIVQLYFASLARGGTPVLFILILAAIFHGSSFKTSSGRCIRRYSSRFFQQQSLCICPHYALLPLDRRFRVTTKRYATTPIVDCCVITFNLRKLQQITATKTAVHSAANGMEENRNTYTRAQPRGFT